MSRVTVEAAFGYSPIATDIVWTDITRYVTLSDSKGISITRGAADELSDTQTGTLSVDLDNSDGRFTPGNASSPYSPNVRRNTPVRVLVTTLTGKNWLAGGSSFESDSHGWVPTPGDAPQAYGRDATHHLAGSFGMKVTWTGVNTGGGLQSTVYGLKIGTQYTASAYVYVAAGSPAVVIKCGGATSAASTVTDAFERLSVTWTTTSAVATLQLTSASSPPAAGTMVWMDQAQVEESATVTSWSSSIARYHTRFFGMVTSWPMGWEGLASEAQLVASDMLKWTSRRPALGPMVVEEVQGDGAQLYYPLSEPEGSMSGGDQSGYSRPSMTIRQSGTGGALTFGIGTGAPSDGLPAPLFEPASTSDGKSLQCTVSPRLTSGGAEGEVIPGDQVYEAWFNTGTSGRVFMKWARGSAPAFDNGIYFQLESGTGKLQVVEYSTFGSTTLTAATPNLANSQPHHFVWDEESGDVWVDGVQYAIGTGVHTDMLLLTVGSTAGSPFFSDPGSQHWVGTVSHVAAYVRNGADGPGPSIADIVDHYQAGLDGHEGETADARMTRLASYVRIPGVTASGTFSTVASQGQLGSSPLSHIRDVERTEGGRLFADRASANLVFQARTVRYNPTPAVSLVYADLETPGVEFSDDDQKLINLITASRPGGATQRIQDAESISLYGVYEQQLDVLKTTDESVTDAATWAIIRYADPQPEMRQLPVEASTLGTTTYRALLDADISSVITVTTLPSQAMAATVTSTVEGYVERILQGRHFLDFHTSRSDTDSVWVLDDTTYSVLGTTTRLAY
ncbi:hypothetical protein AB0A76_09005 [Streptomyces exfoliatus]|uniref:Minor tail protein n=1 Tax=Streptomyces exfoliatus TaxID=1905 RepID=A0ABV3CSZ2_STREX